MMFPRATAVLLSLGASLALGKLQCVNDDTLAAAELPQISLPTYVKRQDAPKEVDVYFHVASTEANQDRISDATVDAQVTHPPSSPKHSYH